MMRLYDDTIIGPERMIVISWGLTVSVCSWRECGDAYGGGRGDAYGEDAGAIWYGRG